MESRYSIIDCNAFAYNVKTVQQRVGRSMIMAIVKANAYGHGIVETSLCLQSLGIHYFGVAFIEEAIILRRAGIELPILVLGGLLIEQLPLFLEYDIEIMASSIEKLLAIDRYAGQYNKKAKVHIKVDTGLGRIGVRYTNIEELFILAKSLLWIDLVGVASHFATSDDQDLTYARQQCARFDEVTQFFPRNGYKMPLRHMANSGAIMQLPESYFDMVRPGIMLYGVYPQSWMQQLLILKPALSLYARIVYFKVVLKDMAVSYGLTWKARENTRVITLPIGYGDGYPRSLSNKGYVLFHGHKYFIIGNICMDQMMIDIKSSQAFCGEEVVLIGTSGNESITINNLADCYGGSPYEFLVLLNSRIVRKYKTILNKF